MARSTLELRQRRHARVRRHVSGTPERPRVAVFRSHKHISAQIINDVTGHTLAAASSVEPALRGAGGNIEGAKKVASALVERALAAGVTTVVFDRGGFDYHGRIAAFAETLRAGGLEF